MQFIGIKIDYGGGEVHLTSLPNGCVSSSNCFARFPSNNVLHDHTNKNIQQIRNNTTNSLNREIYGDKDVVRVARNT